jgi:hypothetical protein
MSAFGIGINTQATNAGIICGTQLEIACGCWFTSTGKTKPYIIKFKDDNGEIQTITNFRIGYSEPKNYCGTPSIEYFCTLIIGGIKTSAKMIYFKDTDKWIINFI